MAELGMPGVSDIAGLGMDIYNIFHQQNEDKWQHNFLTKQQENAEKQFGITQKFAEKQFAYQQYLNEHGYAQKTRALEEAGLNPSLASGSGFVQAAAPIGLGSNASVGSKSTSQQVQLQNFMQSMQVKAQSQQAAAAMDVSSAQAELLRAQADWQKWQNRQQGIDPANRDPGSDLGHTGAETVSFLANAKYMATETGLMEKYGDELKRLEIEAAKKGINVQQALKENYEASTRNIKAITETIGPKTQAEINALAAKAALDNYTAVLTDLQSQGTYLDVWLKTYGLTAEMLAIDILTADQQLLFDTKGRYPSDSQEQHAVVERFVNQKYRGKLSTSQIHDYSDKLDQQLNWLHSLKDLSPLVPNVGIHFSPKAKPKASDPMKYYP